MSKERVYIDSIKCSADKMEIIFTDGVIENLIPIDGKIPMLMVEREMFGKIPEYDPVNKPSHYTDGKIEVIDYIEDKKLGFCLGNAIKYISRAGKKDPTKEVEDLKKAVWYIERRIKKLELLKRF